MHYAVKESTAEMATAEWGFDEDFELGAHDEEVHRSDGLSSHAVHLLSCTALHEMRWTDTSWDGDYEDAIKSYLAGCSRAMRETGKKRAKTLPTIQARGTNPQAWLS
mmetsp:Transcript_3454/g.5234  ORF Transcript_3454/g.5234 Transcript_3454/m.5234 type:complete len:107 (+) Transcript_3454:33-353(+)